MASRSPTTPAARPRSTAVLAHAIASGATLIKPAQKVFWGGYSGYFADPDGHLWEVAYNPGFPLDAAGRMQLPATTPMNHDSYSEDYIRAILNKVRTVALVGASSNIVRPSYFVLKYLMAKGYTMFPVNPGLAGQEILGARVYAALKDIPEPVDMVDIFRNSEAALEITKEAIAIGAKVVWMQLSRPQRRGGGAGGGGRPRGRHEPVPKDRVWPALGRDRLGRRQFGNAVEQADGARAEGAESRDRREEVGSEHGCVDVRRRRQGRGCDCAGRLVFAGFASRDPAAAEHHRLELKEKGVVVPDTIPVCYRGVTATLTQGRRSTRRDGR